MRYLKDYGGRLRRAVSSAALLLILLLYTCGMGSQKFFLPLFTYSADGGKGAAMAVKDGLMSLMPLCCYNQEKVEEPSAEQGGTVEEEEITLHIIEGEGEEGSRMDGEEAGEPVSASGETSEEALQSEAITLEELLAQENSVYRFEAPQKVAEYDWNAMTEYATLISTFYTIDSTAQGGSDLFNLESLMGRDITIDRTGEGPQILIYHTHSREGFIDSQPGNRADTIVGVGDFLAQLLTEQYGYTVLHHTEEFDTVRDSAYANSLPALEKILEQYPSIQVIIDLHRDSGNANRNMVMDIDGRRTARFMFFNGISRSKKTGDIDYLYNPNLAENLAFSFQMQAAAGQYYPGLTRKIYIKQYRYNMHLRGRTLLIELGDENNTVEEAKNACYPLAFLLDAVLSGNAHP
ncbi:MAG: stage II sporulation protein P [Lachnospiraceae bacterium]